SFVQKQRCNGLELWRPTCDHELVPLSRAQRQAQPVAAHVGSLSRDRSECAATCAPSLSGLTAQSDLFLARFRPPKPDGLRPARRLPQGIAKAISCQAEELAPTKRHKRSQPCQPWAKRLTVVHWPELRILRLQPRPAAKAPCEM